MTFPLQGSNQLKAPQQLFQPSATVAPTTNRLSGITRPAYSGDQTRFSRVSSVLGISPIQLPNLRPLGQSVLRGLERGWNALKDTFTFQFEEIKGTAGTQKEAQANCGPASASMILKQFGISSPTMHQLRRSVGAPIGSNSGAYALSIAQVGEAVKKAAKDKGQHITYDSKSLTTNVDSALREMKKRLDAGEKVILLTSNINSLSQGHYIVVKEVRADGSILVDDPGRSKGENAVHSKRQLEKALQTRVQKYGLGNTMISFKRN